MSETEGGEQHLPPSTAQLPLVEPPEDALLDASTITMSTTALYNEDMAEEESSSDDDEEGEGTDSSGSGTSTGRDDGEGERPDASATASPSLDRPPSSSSSGLGAAGACAAPSKPPPPPPTYGSFLHAVVLCVLVVAMSFGINILNLLVYLLIRPVSRVLARRIVGGVFQTMWVNVTAYLLPRSEVVMTGDFPVDPTRPAIIIANHQVDADWWYCWEFARALGLHGRLKIILKADLRNIPVVGWGMRQFEFLFLDRNWQADKRRLYRLLGSFVEDGYEACLLIFPEGTTVNARTFEKSRAFAAGKQRPELDHLVLPRITGFAACLDALSQTGQTPLIYDLTIGYHGYSGEIPTWEMGYSRAKDTDVPNVETMLRGRACPRVHLHATVHEGTEAVLNDAQAFLDERWREKDLLLDRFIKTGGFAPPSEAQVLHPQGSLASLLFLLCVPLLIGLLLPALLLLTLVAWPFVVILNSINFLKYVGRTTIGAGGKHHHHHHHHHHHKSPGVKRTGSRRSLGAATPAGLARNGSGSGLSGAAPSAPPRGVEHSYSRWYKDEIWNGAQSQEEYMRSQQAQQVGDKKLE